MCEETNENSGKTEKTPFSGSVLAVTDKLWVKERLCQCLR